MMYAWLFLVVAGLWSGLVRAVHDEDEKLMKGSFTDYVNVPASATTLDCSKYFGVSFLGSKKVTFHYEPREAGSMVVKVLTFDVKKLERDEVEREGQLVRFRYLHGIPRKDLRKRMPPIRNQQVAPVTDANAEAEEPDLEDVVWVPTDAIRSFFEKPYDGRQVLLPMATPRSEAGKTVGLFGDMVNGLSFRHYYGFDITVNSVRRMDPDTDEEEPQFYLLLTATFKAKRTINYGDMDADPSQHRLFEGQDMINEPGLWPSLDKPQTTQLVPKDVLRVPNAISKVVFARPFLTGTASDAVCKIMQDYVFFQARAPVASLEEFGPDKDAEGRLMTREVDLKTSLPRSYVYRLINPIDSLAFSTRRMYQLLHFEKGHKEDDDDDAIYMTMTFSTVHPPVSRVIEKAEFFTGDPGLSDLHVERRTFYIVCAVVIFLSFFVGYTAPLLLKPPDDYADILNVDLLGEKEAKMAEPIESVPRVTTAGSVIDKAASNPAPSQTSGIQTEVLPTAGHGSDVLS